jgi:cytoskeletal protein CcmA (bactofilin family)
MGKDERGSMQEPAISIIGPGMTVVGDCQTDGTVRIEGRVEGTIRAGKSVVVGRSGEVVGDIYTQDAVISGRVSGSIVAESRLELQSTCSVEGEIRSRRILLDEGGRFNGNVQMSDESEARGGEVLSGRVAGERAEVG